VTPPAHFLASWLVAAAGGAGSRRDRIIVTLAGVLPDLDGLGYGIDWLAERLGRATHLYDWHHLLFHNLGTALACTAAAFLAGARRVRTALLAALAFHLHLAMDLVGSRGPDGSWDVPYLLPFSSAWRLVAPFQWDLDSWQNRVIGLALLATACLVARRKGCSFLEVFSARLDAALVRLLRRAPKPAAEADREAD